MTLWKIVLSYDGSAFHGWQVQPGRPTVQGTLAAVLEKMTGERVLPQGSGRTDAGVHALGQVASFALEASIPAENLLTGAEPVAAAEYSGAEGRGGGAGLPRAAQRGAEDL